MKQGNWNSRKSRKKDINGCHRGARYVQRRSVTIRDTRAPRSLGAIAASIALAMMRPFRRGNR